MMGSNSLIYNWSNSSRCRDISDAFPSVSRNHCCPYLLVHFLEKCASYLPTWYISFGPFNSSTLSLKPLVADMMGQNNSPGHIRFNSRHYRTHTNRTGTLSERVLAKLGKKKKKKNTPKQKQAKNLDFRIYIYFFH